MAKKWNKKKLALIAPLAILAMAAFGLIVMLLWNWLVPAMFGGRTINYWQAWGVLILTRILFGGFHGGPGRDGRWKHRMRERLEQMTPEERERFLRGLGSGPQSGAPSQA